MATWLQLSNARNNTEKLRRFLIAIPLICYSITTFQHENSHVCSKSLFSKAVFSIWKPGLTRLSSRWRTLPLPPHPLTCRFSESTAKTPAVFQLTNKRRKRHPPPLLSLSLRYAYVSLSSHHFLTISCLVGRSFQPPLQQKKQKEGMATFSFWRERKAWGMQNTIFKAAETKKQKLSASETKKVKKFSCISVEHAEERPGKFSHKKPETKSLHFILSWALDQFSAKACKVRPKVNLTKNK